jgi:hypothetical protein
MKWVKFADRLPDEGDTPILVFPCFIDCGFMIQCANRTWARSENRTEATHWAEIDLPPDYDAINAKWRKECLNEQVN